MMLRTLTALILSIVAVTGITLSSASSVKALDSSSTTAAETPLESVLDSLRTETESERRWDRFVTSTDWDSTSANWVPSAADGLRGSSGWTRLKVSPAPRYRYNKVEGPTPGVGATLQWGRRPGLRLSGGYDRATGPGRYSGEVMASFQSHVNRAYPFAAVSRSRMTGSGPETRSSVLDGGNRRSGWRAYVGYAERPVAFGANRPLSNFVQASLLSLDAQNYLQREERVAGLQWHFTRSLLGEVAYTQRKDSALHVPNSPFWNTDPAGWRNAAIDAVDTQGIVARMSWSQPFTTDNGVWLRAGAFGGSLGGDREFYPVGLEVRRAFKAPLSARLETGVSATAVGGRPPRQEWADLGGVWGLRAHRSRALTGRAAAAFRADYMLGVDLFRQLSVPLLDRLRIQPSLFVDVGAVWGRDDWTDRKDLTGPESSDIRTDFGFGLSRHLGYVGIVNRARVDFGWRTDRAEDRFRVSLSITP